MSVFFLNIETSTTNCSVSISENNDIISLCEINNGYKHAENLLNLVKKCLHKSSLQLKQLNAIAISKGPRSYTGLRIGVSTAKGLAYALNIPLISVDTLTSMNQNPIIKNYTEIRIPMIDARRMEVYFAIFKENEKIRETTAEIIEKNSFSNYTNYNIVLFGTGAEKCNSIFSDYFNIQIINNIFPSANDMATLTHEKWLNNDFENIAYFEPFYLKDFVVTTSKKIYN